MTDARPRAERAIRRRLLNAYLRESGRALSTTGDGLGRITLSAPEHAVVVEVLHRSEAGYHVYGDQMWLEHPGSPRTQLAHAELVDVLLDEVEALAERVFGTPADDPGVKAVFATQIAGSAAATARYLDRLERGDGPGSHALTRHSEQSLVFGHPFHPTPKATAGFGEDLPRYAPELGAEFVLHWIAVRREATLQRRVAPGSWIPDVVSERAADLPDDGDFTVLPVHPWQANYLRHQEAFARLLDEGTVVDLGPLGNVVYPTSSVRTVCDPASATAWKLPLHVRVTNFVRNNPVEHVQRAADAGALVAVLAPTWRYDGFGVLNETGFAAVDPDVAGEELAAETAVLFRENPFTDGTYAPRVVAGLLDGDAAGLVAELRRSAGGSTPGTEHVAEWLRRYLHLWLVPLLDVFDTDGVSFEAHVQNCLLHTENGWPSRVWVRDMEGTSVSRKRVRPGLVADGSPLLYDDQEAWQRLRYHAVTNHLCHLVHVLSWRGGAKEARLWAAARELLAGLDSAPADELLAAPVLPAKANLVSRFAERGERPWYADVPNPLYAGSVPVGRR